MEATWPAYLCFHRLVFTWPSTRVCDLVLFVHYMSFEEEDAVVSVGDSVVNISGFYFSTYSATRLASQLCN